MKLAPLAEIRAFRAAIRAAKAPPPTWDILGLRHLLRRTVWVLTREHVAPARLGLAVFVGVFVGCTPLYGFHMLLVLSAAFALRLNKLALWLGVQVSMPLIAPFVHFTELQLGHRLIRGQWASFSLQAIRSLLAGDSAIFWQVLRQWFLIWGLGALLVGVTLGVALGSATFWLARRRRA